MVSTVQDVPENQVVPILEAIAKTAKLTMTPVQEATKGITGMLVAFGETTNVANVQRTLAQYQRAIFTVPGGAAAGPQIIQQLPQLAAVSRLAAVNPEQMFGLLNTVLRAGGTPATSARGLQYLVQGLAQPPSIGAGRALAGIGVTPQFVQEQGGIAGLIKLIEEIRRRGVTGAGPRGKRLRGLPADLEDQLEGLSSGEQLAGLGISGAGAVFARKAVGRIHGVRSLILLAAQEDQMIEDLREMADLGRNHERQVQELGSSWKRFEDKAQLHAVAIAIDQMAVDVAQVFEPVLNWAGGGVKALRDVVDKNPQFAVGVGGAALTALMLGRRLGLGGLAKGFAGVQAVQDVATGAEARGDSPTHPVWVAVAYALSGPGGGGFFGGRKGAGGGGTPPVGCWNTWRRCCGSREQGETRGFTALPWLGAGPLLVGSVVLNLPGEGGQLDPGRVAKVGSPLVKALLQKRMTNTTDFSAAEMAALEMLGGARPGTKGWSKDKANRAERLLRGSDYKDKPIRLQAKGEVTVNVEGLPGGTQKKTVPLDLWSDFTQPAPTTRGKPKTYRSG